MDQSLKRTLVQKALEVRENSYAPYSKFKVGAAILCGSDHIYSGCNVENASYGAGICAERGAAMKAVSNGERLFKAVAIVGFYDGLEVEDRGLAYPCGICRQFLREFCQPEDLIVIVGRSEDDWEETTLAALLPESFGPENL